MPGPIRPDAPIARSWVSPEIPRATRNDGPSFAEVFKQVVNDSANLQDDAKELIGAFLRGEPVELHQVMAASEEASISLELLVELRNKFTEAYRTVMSIQ